MIALLLLAAAPTPVAPPAPKPNPYLLRDAGHAIDAGRLDQAKLMIAQAVAAGYRGEPIQHLTADLAFASHNYEEALAGYKALASLSPRPPLVCERGAISALQVGRVADAQSLADCAVAAAKPSWRAWNARGVAADLVRDWASADQSYANARELAPQEAEVINNQGWSRLLRGDWPAALPLFEKAAALDPGSQRIANNVELARVALGASLPKQRPGESAHDWAERLNDAGVAAQLLGDKKRALAAFTQALEASPTWYQRASDNLQTVSTN